MELLLPMAARKLDLSFDIAPDVPPCESRQLCHTSISDVWEGVTADYDRIRQGMIKFSPEAFPF